MTLLFCVAGTSAFASFSGSYTIDPNSAASSTNYLDFTSAVNDLNGVGRTDGGPDNYDKNGVVGATEFEFAKGYSAKEQIEINEINGASSTNTITFIGHGANIYYTASSGSRHTIFFNGADYITLKDMYIQGLDTDYAYAIRFANSSNFNVIEGCTVEVSNFANNYPHYYSYMASACIAFTSNSDYLDEYAYGSSYGTNGNGNTISNCDIRGTSYAYGPTYGIFDAEDDYNFNTFTNNKIHDFFCVGVMALQTDGELIQNNEIWRESKYYVDYNEIIGIFLPGADANNQEMRIENNRIHNLQGSSGGQEFYCYGILSYSGKGGSSSNNSYFINNAIYDNASNYNYGAYFDNPSKIKFYNNTIALDNQDGGNVETMGFYTYHYVSDNNEIINNNISITEGGNGSKYGLFIQNPTNYNEHDNNCWINSPNGTNYYGYNNNYSSTYANWVSNGSSSADRNENPNFYDEANGQFQAINFALNNSGYNVGINTDIDGTTRNVKEPDLGAFEAILDVSATSKNFSKSPVCAGYTEYVTIDVENNTDYDFNGVKVAININGVIITKESIPATVYAHSVYNHTFNTPIILSQAGTNIIDIYIVSDDIVSNNSDTKSVFVKPSPGGSVFTANLSSKGILDYKGMFDVITENEKIIYDVTSPRKYNDGDYSTKWTASASITTLFGNPVTPGTVSYTHSPTGVLTVTAPAAFVDSILLVSLSVNDISSGCDTVFTRKIKIAPKGKPFFVTPNVLCDKDDINFDNQSTIHSGSLTYMWDFGDLTTDDAINPVHKFNGSGTYTVKLTSTSEPYGFISDTTISIVINEIPKTNFTRVNACDGSPVKFINKTTISGSSPITYDWDFGDGTAHSNTLNASHQYSAVNAYRAVLKATSNGCFATISKNVYMFARPVANFVAPISSTCEGKDVILSNSSTISQGEAGSYWQFGDAGYSSSTNGVHAYKSEGIYNVKLTMISEFNCTDSITKQITIKSAPVAAFSYDRACTVNSTILTNTSTSKPGQNPQYIWSYDDGSSQTTPNTTHKWSSKGLHTVSLSVMQANGCEASVSKTVDVLVQPKANFTITDGCSGVESIIVNKTTVEEGTLSNMWEFGDGATSNQFDPVHTYVTSTSQTYNIKLVSTVGGCNDTAQKVVTISQAPSCGFTVKHDYVNGLNAYTFSPDNNTYSEYHWQFGDGGASSNNKPSYVYSNEGVYSVIMKATNNIGCNCEQTFKLKIDNNSSVENITTENNINLFPNPSTGKVTITIDGNSNTNELNVYNMLGELVITYPSGNTAGEIDLSGYANGVYLIKIKSKTSTITKKVTINR
ncbi:MAG: PKD domain-containing protein [Bacteroidia bacterium]|nr:PKD domain-containing protein [Bacteroidia bacterium]